MRFMEYRALGNDCIVLESPHAIRPATIGPPHYGWAFQDTL
uniref:Diaminopimelate epimerase n=1 Tax=Candidatus Kentrum eta TaxID=2126337 RepID=A0A450UI51_9GAMM|nr:MAG: hypothetical protein BECKH772A_GA0070896_1002813 [Candidatus Kentron sp. H]VFJ92221.1 MAG: hypothetical protein BECKH772B_GA0070898_1002613 [Candidatus Kentron sp. H]VFJ98883.1 MAG: hypothetical protein BECKH772C_GA0070978_1002613 [Candidatus Kentron sp. H]